MSATKLARLKRHNYHKMAKCKVCGCSFAVNFTVLWSREPGVCIYCNPREKVQR